MGGLSASTTSGRAAQSPGQEPGRDGIITLADGRPLTLLRKLNARDYAGAGDEFLAWKKAGVPL